MYTTIHPYHYDEAKRCFVPEKPFFVKADSIDGITPAFNVTTEDKKMTTMSYIIFDNPSIDKTIITSDEAEAIKQLLTEKRPDPQADLSKHVECLTTAVRDLWILLRARMR